MAEIRGLEQFRRNVEALTQQVDLRAALKAIEAGAQLFADGMARRAPRDTGQLAGDIVTEILLDGRRGYVAKIGPSRRSFYGQFLEFGTVHRMAHPFVRPTLDEDRVHVHRTMEVEFRTAVEKLVRAMRT